ncbi:MAG: AMP-binding protein [Bacteroidetes bacterium]|nr:AMP-binding protein [Bacteroidota bacterium]
MSFLILEQEKIFFTDIPERINQDRWSPYSQAILTFCMAWWSSQNSFGIETSGTTGPPKTISWTRALMLWSINNTALALQLKKEMHCLHCIDVSKAGGKMMLARALQLGMSLEIIEPSANPFNGAISSHYDFAAMVPLQIHRLQAENTIESLNKIDVLIIGGAALSSSLMAAIQPLQTQIYATYGMTETASHIALQHLNGDKRDLFFRPLNGIKISVGENNCAIITTPFQEHLITNDLIELQETGAFKLLGRQDNIINSGGYKISLEKVESAFDKSFTTLKINFFNYCAYKQPDERLGEALIVILETPPLEDLILEALKTELRNYLEKYEMPKYYYFMNSLEYTSSGKIDRKTSAEKYFSR